MTPEGDADVRATFCSACGAATETRIPAGDDRPRAVCTACGSVHYRNPLVVVGAMVEHDDGLLLCRRAIEPARGRFTMPAGFLELGESLEAGAVRETREEACADVDVTAPFALLDVAPIGQVYALFHARLRAPAWAPGPESLSAEIVPFEDIAWDEIAFPVIRFALQLYVSDRRAGARRLHTGVVRWMGRGSRYDAVEYELAEHRTYVLTGSVRT